MICPFVMLHHNCCLHLRFKARNLIEPLVNIGSGILFFIVTMLNLSSGVLDFLFLFRTLVAGVIRDAKSSFIGIRCLGETNQCNFLLVAGWSLFIISGSRLQNRNSALILEALQTLTSSRITRFTDVQFLPNAVSFLKIAVGLFSLGPSNFSMDEQDGKSLPESITEDSIY